MDSGAAAMADIGDSDAAGDAGSELEPSFGSAAGGVAVGGVGGAGACDSADCTGSDRALSFDSATAGVSGATVGGLVAGRDGSIRAVFFDSFDSGAVATPEVGGFDAARDGSSPLLVFLD